MPNRFLAGAMPAPQVRSSERVPDPTFLGAVGAGFRTALDEQGVAQAWRLRQAYDPLVDALVERGVDRRTLMPNTGMAPGASLFAAAIDGAPFNVDRDALWKAVADARARDPKAFADLADRDAFEQRVLTRDGARRGDQATAERGGIAARLIGGAGASFADPINVLTLPLGGGKTIAQTILREAIVNAGVEAVETPILAGNLGRLGEKLTPEQAAINIAAAGVAGGVLGGAGKAVELHGGTAVRAAGDRVAMVREAGIARVWDRLPVAVRERWAAASDIGDDDLPELAELAIGRANLGEEERAAVEVVRRETAIGRANPFVANGAGVAAHQDNLAAALGRILADEQKPAPRTRLAAGTAMATGAVQPASRVTADTIFAGLVRQESGGRRGVAGPMTRYGQAHGLTQVLDSTAQAMARRIGVPWQPALMRGTSDEAAAYQLKIGRAYFDEGMARSGGDVRRALMFYHGGPDRRLWGAKTNAYADTIIARTGGRVELRGDVVADLPDVDRAAIQTDLDRLTAERVALEAQTRDAAPNADPWAREAEPVVEVADAELLPARAAETEPLTRLYRGEGRADDPSHTPMPREVTANGPATGRWFTRSEEVARTYAGDRGQIFVVDVPTRQLDEASEKYRSASNGEERLLNQEWADRKVALDPVPAPPAPRQRASGTSAPEDALTYLARRGGLRDDEGHDLRGRGRLISGAVTGQKRRAGGGGERLPRFAPGGGHLFKRNGMTIDEAGELLNEAGFIRGERPTAAEVLDYLEGAAGERRYRLEDEGVVVERARAAEERAWLAETQSALDDIAHAVGEPLTDAEIAGTRRYMADGYSAWEGWAMHVEDEAMARADRISTTTADPDYDIPFIDDIPFVEGTARDGFEGTTAGRGAQGGDGQSPDAGRSAGFRDIAAQAGEAGTAGRPPDALTRGSAASFDDPDGAAARATVDSLDHDARAALDRGTAVDPAIADRQRQQAALKAASPMQGAVDQDGTIGMGLFDAVDQTGLRLADDAPEQTLADLFRGLDDEQAAIDAVRGCL